MVSRPVTSLANRRGCGWKSRIDTSSPTKDLRDLRI